MTRVRFQQRKLLVGPLADVSGQSPVVFPEVFSHAVHRETTLEKFGSSGFVIGSGAADAIIELASLKVGLKARVDRLRISLLAPNRESFKFFEI
jgi:hypothetical protein